MSVKLQKAASNSGLFVLSECRQCVHCAFRFGCSIFANSNLRILLRGIVQPVDGLYLAASFGHGLWLEVRAVR